MKENKTPRADKILLDIFSIRIGIMPECNSGPEFRKMLLELSPEERRKVKRKFRKFWRQLTRRDNIATISHGAAPSETELARRRKLVFAEIVRLARLPKESGGFNK